jgi:outer membrane translocation and assembly module TamA
MPVVADDGIFFFSRRPRPNPEIDEGRMRTLLFTARWSEDAPLFARWIDEQDSFLLRTVYGTPFQYVQGARVEGTYELATDALGGDFSFGRFTGQVRAARMVGARHHVLGRVLGGFTNGDPPLQRRFALGGLGTVRGYSYKQFPGEQMVVATGEWMAATRGRWPSVVAFVDGGRAWTSGVDGAGWKSSAGVGLDFRPLSRGYARIDVAFPFQKSPGQDGARVYGMIQLPF